MASERASERMNAPNVGEKSRFSSDTSSRRVYAYPIEVGRSVLINTLTLYPPLGWMVETKDSARFVPPIDEGSFARSLSPWIGRVRSHKLPSEPVSLVCKHTGGFPFTRRYSASRPHRRARSISLLLDGNSNRHCRSLESSALLRIANTVDVRADSFFSFSSLSPLIFLSFSFLSPLGFSA